MMRQALVVEDDTSTATLLAESLTSSGFTVELAANAEEAHKILSRHEPDVILIDLHLGSGPSGFDVAHYVARHHPETAILAITQHQAPEFIGQGQQTLPAHAVFMSKNKITSIDELLHSIDTAMVAERNRHNKISSDTPLNDLTKTQAHVLCMLAQGYRTSEIATARNTTNNAVEQVLTAIYQALDIKSNPAVNPRTEAVRIYIENAGLPARAKPE